ncbi:MAG: PilZ domain-containing protein [Planctomycetota bacterium]
MGEFKWLERVCDYFRGENRRKRGRVRPMDVRTTIGDIQNLSGGGMRLRTSKRKFGQEGKRFKIPIRTAFGDKLDVSARTVWCKQVDEHLFDVGVCWAEPEREQATIARLIELTCCGNNTAMNEPSLPNFREDRADHVA